MVPNIIPYIGRKERFCPMIEYVRENGFTVRQFAIWVGRNGFSFAGSAEDIANYMSKWYNAGAVVGFVVMPP